MQNSSRTKFYKRFILKDSEWSSSETVLEPGQKKNDFDKEPVLDRMEIQLNKSNIPTTFIKNIDLRTAIVFLISKVFFILSKFNSILMSSNGKKK